MEARVFRREVAAAAGELVAAATGIDPWQPGVIEDTSSVISIHCSWQPAPIIGNARR